MARIVIRLDRKTGRLEIIYPDPALWGDLCYRVGARVRDLLSKHANLQNEQVCPLTSCECATNVRVDRRRTLTL